MLLGNLLKSTEKKYKQISIKNIVYDSRRIKKKDIFFAINGTKTTGTKFINSAISKGASVIVSDERLKNESLVPLILVKDARKSLAEACSNFYKRKPKNIIAVTGTNGKSSVADFFYQILEFNNIPVASIGTLGVLSKNYKKKTNLTSINPLSLHKNLNILAKNKVNHVILEASSHGLKQRRLDNLNIKIGIFTNLSHDHLDYHADMKSYFNSKMYLFKNLMKKNSTIITDEKNKEFKTIKAIANKKKKKKKTIGQDAGSIKILYNKYKQNKQLVKILINSKQFILKIPLIGYFQVKNLLMAALAASSCGLSLNKIFSQIHKIRPAPGRLELIANLKNNSSIVVDFAHTPDALEQSLIALKDQFKKEIIIVFGCGGERDKKKRLIMGKIAKKYCRKVIVTDDNPRSENPKKIRSSIIKGCRKLALDIGDRKKAIRTAINELRSNEILLVAGRGHEEKQDYGNKSINFSDRKVVKEIIKKKKSYLKNYCHQDFILKKALNNSNIKNIKYSGVSINTKTIKKNNLFFAIKGKKMDGHKFLADAIRKGAIKSIVSKNVKKIFKNKVIKVKDVFLSLNDLAKTTRENTSAQILGITGSVGKTTVKNLVSFALKKYGNVHSSPYSYNNKFGVSLSIANLKNNTEFGVFEIGMDKKGEIGNLSKIVKPELAIITNISGAHFKNFNTLKDIARAKAEIIDNIIKGGTLVINKDDKFFKFFSHQAKRKKINIVSFSTKNKANIFLLQTKKIKNYFRIKVSIEKRIFNFNVPHQTDNFISNILGCISILSTLDLNLELMKNRFINFPIPSGRGDVKLVNNFKKFFVFIDESYNANPLSMSSAIKNMSYFKTKKDAKKLVFLGDMLELGSKSKKFHKELSNEINKSEIDKVFVYGKYIKETFNYLSKNKKGKVFNTLNDAYVHFGKIIHNNDLLMVKGSNATGLNKFSKRIKKEHINAI